MLIRAFGLSHQSRRCWGICHRIRRSFRHWQTKWTTLFKLYSNWRLGNSVLYV